MSAPSTLSTVVAQMKWANPELYVDWVVMHEHFGWWPMSLWKRARRRKQLLQQVYEEQWNSSNTRTVSI